MTRSETLQEISVPDLLLVALLTAAVLLAVGVGFNHLNPGILHYSTWDYWFESDAPGVADQILDRWSRNHLRTSHHPLFSILVSLPVQILRSALHLSSQQAVGLVVVVVAAGWIAVFFLCLRVLGLRRLDAIVFTALAAVSAYAVFWFPVPESFGLGALSIGLALLVTAWSERYGNVPTWVYLAASIATLSFTSTNWMVGLAMLAVLLSWRRALALAVASFVLVMGMWYVQWLIFPTSGSPLLLDTPAETIYIFNKAALGPLAKLVSFFFHSVIMPQISEVYGYRLSIQGMLPGGGGTTAAAGTVIWGILLILGGWSAFRLRNSVTTLVLLLSIFGQLVLALVFGVETFLYSAHFGPLLVLLCALTSLTGLRRFAITLAITLIFLASANNFQKFAAAADGLRQRYYDERSFTASVARLTSPDGLIICGRQAAAAVGEEPWIDFRSAPPTNIVLNCFVKFEGLRFQRHGLTYEDWSRETGFQRRGWVLPYEDWSMETFEVLRRRGARYLVTPYEFGIKHKAALFAELDRSFRTLERNEKWVFYDLQLPAPNGR